MSDATRSSLDPVLDDATVLAVVRRHVSQARAVAGIDESGGEARAYAIDQDVVLKTQRPHRVRPRTSLEKEACFLRHLASNAGDPLPVPRVLGYGGEGALEYVCLSRVPGVAALHATLAPAARTAVLRHLASVLVRIHRVPQQPLLDSGLFPADRTPGDLEARVDRACTALAGACSDAGMPWPLARAPAGVAVTLCRAIAQTSRPPLVAVHSNPGPVHTFVDPDTGAFTGLIDFGDAYISHPAFDLARWPDVADCQALLDAYAAAGGCEVDESFVAAWRVAVVLAELQIAVRRPDRAATAVAQANRLLECL